MVRVDSESVLIFVGRMLSPPFLKPLFEKKWTRHTLKKDPDPAVWWAGQNFMFLVDDKGAPG